MPRDDQEPLQAALVEVARAIAASLEVRVVWDRVADAFRSVVAFDAMGIVKLEPGGRVRAVAAAGDLAAKALAGRTFARSDYSPAFWPDRDRFTVVIREAAQELDPAYVTDRLAIDGGYRSCLRLSLGDGGRRLGSVLLVAREPARFTAEHGRALAVATELVAVALAHEQLAQQLREETARSAAATEQATRLELRVKLLA